MKRTRHRAKVTYLSEIPSSAVGICDRPCQSTGRGAFLANIMSNGLWVTPDYWIPPHRVLAVEFC